MNALQSTHTNHVRAMWLAVALAIMTAVAYVLIAFNVLGVGDLLMDEKPPTIIYVAAGCYLLGGLLILLRRRWLLIFGAGINALVILFFFRLYQDRPAVMFSPGGLASKTAQILLEVALLYIIAVSGANHRPANYQNYSEGSFFKTEQNMKTTLIIACILVALFFIGWLGLQIKPKSFLPYSEKTTELQTIPLPSGLPAPVERFYKTVYGENIPVIETAVIKGRAFISPFGVKLPARFLFVHNVGKDYRHYFEATWFGIPIMKVNERFLDGKSLFELPVGDPINNDASTNQAANLAVWAEAAWFPSIWITDPRVHWEAVDEKTALLFVPFEDQEENFVMRFNPDTGLLDSMEAMRFRDSGPQAKKILWITRNIEGKKIDGTQLDTIGSATWLDQGKPWATFTLEEVNYNVDVSKYIRQKGP